MIRPNYSEDLHSQGYTFSEIMDWPPHPVIGEFECVITYEGGQYFACIAPCCALQQIVDARGQVSMENIWFYSARGEAFMTVTDARIKKSGFVLLSQVEFTTAEHGKKYGEVCKKFSHLIAETGPKLSKFNLE